jgi:phosphonate transport system substrate-binding protein
MKEKIQQAFLQAHIKNKAAFDKLSDGKNDPFVKVTHAEFEPVVAMNKFVDNLRKKQ